MNKKAILAVLLSTAVVGSTASIALTASASDEIIYGTMEIPYSEFYAGEGIDGVDAVSSATASKWKNENLVSGTYNVETENGGDILGVRYYVALTEETLAQLGDNNYNFARIDEVPSAYKNVMVQDGNAVFSEIIGAAELAEGRSASITTVSNYGDYTITVDAVNNANGTSDFGTIYGIVLKTEDGSEYGMRHLENIWRDQIAWSSGIKTVESHGNVLNYEQYESLMGKTIKEITYITETGYHTIPVDLYVPVKFEGSVEIENADIDNGSTAFTETGFPEDFNKEYNITGDGDFAVGEGIIEYENVIPGSYTLTVSDLNGKYADVSASFVIATDSLPVAFDGEKVTAAEDYSEESAKLFIKNISSAEVNGTAYAASGKRGVKIINEDGTINSEAAPFGEEGDYSIVVTATGYNNPLVFTFTKAPETLLYGTMEIPYSEFYAGEGIDGVDAVSSATTGKWKNENLVSGTYSIETENGGGDILGVRYYVALTEGTLAQLGENNYNFEPLDEEPTAYKLITIEDGEVVFSSVAGAAEAVRKEVTLSTDMVWGDYVLDISGLNNANGSSEFGTVYGVILRTAEGDRYGMRHLENIWRDEIAWSSGIQKTEPHGNTLSYENYVGLMGQTLTEITFITETGYHTIPVDIYVPVKFENTLEVADMNINDTATTYKMEGFPEDFSPLYIVNGQYDLENAAAVDGILEIKAAYAGSYTFTVRDENGKYADVSTDFVISTDAMPAVFDGEKLVPAEGVSAEDFAAFMKNIATVTVDENSYSASGKRSVKIINEDGTINLEAVSGETAIFGEEKTYNIIVTATGYNTPLAFVLNGEEDPSENSADPSEDSSEVSEDSQVSEESEVSENPEVSQNSENSVVDNNSNTDNNSNNSNTSDSNSNSGVVVNTGSSNFALAAVLTAGFSALAAVFSFKKKKKEN